MGTLWILGVPLIFCFRFELGLKPSSTEPDFGGGPLQCFMKLLLKFEFQSRELKTLKWTFLKTVVEVAFYYKTLLNLATEVLKSNSTKCKKILLQIVTYYIPLKYLQIFIFSKSVFHCQSQSANMRTSTSKRSWSQAKLISTHKTHINMRSPINYKLWLWHHHQSLRSLAKPQTDRQATVS